MKITGITTKEFRWPRHKPIANGKHTYTHVNFAVAEIATDDGITGIGLGSGGAIERSTIEHLKPLLIGEDPIDVERLWHKMWVPKLIGRRGLTTRAIAALDIGLWDIRAKRRTSRFIKCLAVSATVCRPTSPVAITRKAKASTSWPAKWKTMSVWVPKPSR
jgi:L-alanine-DL-glutamate epimerase-like enolase superfamily enzyme